MKKVKEYYQTLKDTPPEELKSVLYEIFASFNSEIRELLEIRKIKKQIAIITIIEEQNNKWNSLCRLCEKNGLYLLNKNSVIKYWEKSFPELFQ